MNKLWGWLAKRTQPHPNLTDAEDRRRARLLANLSFALAVILTLAFVISVFTSIFFPNPAISLGLAGTVLILVAAVGFWFSYRQSVTLHYKRAAWITIITTYVFLTGFMVVPQYQSFSTSLVLGYAVPVLLATIFLNSAGTVRVFVYSVIFTIAILIFQSVLVVNFAFVFAIILVVTLLVVLVAVLREQDLRQVQRLRELEAADRDRLKQELDLARKVQLSMLPKELPELAELQVAAFSQPAYEASGDFYDIFPLKFAGNERQSNKLGIAVCDVAGKGISSALVMSATRAALRAEAENANSPARVLAKVNEMLAASLPSGLFVTLFYGIYDVTTRELQYASGGHPHPYYYSGTGMSELESFGMPLGLLAESEYEDFKVTLATGDSIFIYTDGLVEALNVKREMYGFDTVRDNVARYAAQKYNAKDLLRHTISDMETFLDGERPHDDITVVVLQLN